MILFILLFCFCILVSPVHAEEPLDISETIPFSLSSEVYEGSPYNSTINLIWEGLIDKHASKDYIAFRASQSEYTIIFTDSLSFADGVFSGEGQFYTINTSSYSSSSGAYQLISGTDSFVITPNEYIVFSSIGDYPSIGGSSDVYSKATFFVVCALFLYLVIYKLFR